jgi:hypothetical protein
MIKNRLSRVLAGTMEDSDNEHPAVSLTGFSAAAAAASVITTEESCNLSNLFQELAENSNSDEEERKWGSSREGRSANIKHDFAGAHSKLVEQYFSGDDSQYTPAQFKRRYRVSPSIFEKIYQTLYGKGAFLPEGTKDALGNPCIYPLVRLTAVFRTLAYMGLPLTARMRTYTALQVWLMMQLATFVS